VERLIKETGGDDVALANAWNKIGQYYSDWQKWAKAAQYYTQVGRRQHFQHLQQLLHDHAYIVLCSCKVAATDSGQSCPSTGRIAYVCNGSTSAITSCIVCCCL
jgi:hypothetical protein